MENTVTISITEFDQLRNEFKNSPDRKKLEEDIKYLQGKNENLKEELDNFKKSDFVLVIYYGYLLNKKKYFRKDNTPLWIRKFFNNL